jgi:hypothetical protein
MEAPLGIGDFARMSCPSVKTLRHDHEIGLLEPAWVGPATGHRHYEISQVPTGRVPPFPGPGHAARRTVAGGARPGRRRPGPRLLITGCR